MYVCTEIARGHAILSGGEENEILAVCDCGYDKLFYTIIQLCNARVILG